MKNVSEVVLECHNKLLQEKGINKNSGFEMPMNREYGIDSLGIVTLLLEIEEELEIDLDSVLADIRKCKNIGELVNIVERKVSE